MAAVFGCSPDAIDESVSTETMDKWDSLRHMNLIVALEEAFGIEFDENDIMSLLSYGDIVKTIDEKRVRVVS
ncbi:acyl carrier protein [Desulfatiferula olefinivorans]